MAGRPRKHNEGELCETCGERDKMSSGHHADGTVKFKATCSTCHKAKYIRPWLLFRGEECEYCGWIPMFSWSLDVHHRDGDKTNNTEENLTTVCPTCHRDLESLIRELDGDRDKAESLYQRFIKRLIR